MVKVRPRERDLDETLTAQPGYALVGVVRVPEAQVSPLRAIWRRVAVALLATGMGFSRLSVTEFETLEDAWLVAEIVTLDAEGIALGAV